MSRSAKVVKVLLYLQTNKLACHRFLDAGGRYKIPGSEMKGSLLFTATVVARISVFLCYSLAPIHKTGGTIPM